MEGKENRRDPDAMRQRGAEVEASAHHGHFACHSLPWWITDFRRRHLASTIPTIRLHTTPIV